MPDAAVDRARLQCNTFPISGRHPIPDRRPSASRPSFTFDCSWSSELLSSFYEYSEQGSNDGPSTYIDADLVSRIIDITFAVLGVLALVQFVSGVWRGFRWCRARHFERMLEDPARAGGSATPRRSRQGTQVAVPQWSSVAASAGLVVAMIMALVVATKLIPNKDKPADNWRVTDWRVHRLRRGDQRLAARDRRGVPASLGAGPAGRAPLQ